MVFELMSFNGYQNVCPLLGDRVFAIKLLTLVIYKGSCLAGVFVPGRPFQPSTVLVGKARSLPQS
jgi:hypothetical protein